MNTATDDPCPDIDSWALVRAAQVGDMDAWARLWQHHHPQMMRYARWLTWDREEAADAVNEAFTRALRRLPQVQPSGEFGGWLATILRNVIFDWRKASANRLTGRADPWMVASMVPPTPDLTSASAVTTAAGAAVRAALATLPPRQSEALTLRYLRDLTWDEVSSATGTSVTACKQLAVRGGPTLARRLRHWREGVA